jgi:TolA-binding protein
MLSESIPGAGNCRRMTWRRLVLTSLALLAVAGWTTGCKSKSEDERLQSAQELLAQKNVLGAIIAYEDFIKKFPQSEKLIEAQMGLASAYFMERDFVKCRELLDTIIKNSGGQSTRAGFSAQLVKLETFIVEQKPAEALTEALATSDTLRLAAPELRHGFQLRLAQLFETNKEPEKAAPVYEGILMEKAATQQMNLAHLEAILRLVALNVREKREDDALKVFANYLEAHPESELRTRLYTDWGKLLRQLGRNDEANVQFEQAAQIAQSQIDNAAGADQKALNMLVLADINQLRGQTEEARALYRKVIDDFPLSNFRGNAMMNLAESQYEAGDVESALATLDQMIKDFPKSQAAAQAFRRQQEIKFARSGIQPTTDTLTGTPLPGASETPAEESESAPVQEEGSEAEPEDAPSAPPAQP